ncbi:hypothetical protein AB0E01_18935 [Nocardia vinacea]|uniref:hypothetical protein n=1 Tax=Nocardia vinacea TaxID=96468 RepID=UPI0033EF25D4
MLAITGHTSVPRRAHNYVPSLSPREIEVLRAWILSDSKIEVCQQVIGAIPPLLALAAVVAAAALSQLPASRLVQRVDVARVVRERAR